MRRSKTKGSAASQRAVEDPGASGANDVFRLGFVLAGACLVVMGFDCLGGSRITGAAGWIITLALFGASALAGLVGRVLAIWAAQVAAMSPAPEARSARDESVLRYGFREMFAYLVVCLTGLAAIIFVSAQSGRVGANQVRLVTSGEISANGVHIAVYLAFLAASFVPLIIGFYLQARVETGRRNQKVFRDDVVSLSTFVITSGVIGSIILLAWAAGDEMFEMSDDFGIVITLLVILAFLVIILYPHLARYWNDRDEARTTALAGAQANNSLLLSPVRMVSRLDSLLVRLVAPLSGATQKGPGVPHLLLLLVIVPLSAMGYVLASPFGLIPIFLAMLIALALGRRWAWVEDDRETASRLQTTNSGDIHIGFENDLKDEALLGYASLFVLVPLALSQLQGWTGSFVATDSATGNAFLDWLRFFGAELAKAVPFVDWWEIYNVEIDTPFDARTADNPLAKHLTFAARAMVDLVIMAALFQAIAIWQRHRMQQKLYDSGHLDAFDPFMEEEFFENGMQSGGNHDPVPKGKFSERIERHADAKSSLMMPRTPYSQRRLSELIASDNLDVRAGARWMVKHFEMLAGEPREQLAQLSARWDAPEGNPLRAAAARSEEGAARLRVAKIEIERVLAELTSTDELIEGVGDQEVGYLLNLMEAVKDAPEFNYAHILVLELIGTRTTETAVLALACHILHDYHFDAAPTWSERFEREMGRVPPLLLGQQEMRWKVYDALRTIGQNSAAGREVRVLALELLHWMATPPSNDANAPRGAAGDKAVAARNLAAERASEVLQSLKPS